VLDESGRVSGRADGARPLRSAWRVRLLDPLVGTAGALGNVSDDIVDE